MKLETLKLTDETAIIPENSHLFASYGAALSAKETSPVTDFEALENKLKEKIFFALIVIPPYGILSFFNYILTKLRNDTQDS